MNTYVWYFFTHISILAINWAMSRIKYLDSLSLDTSSSDTELYTLSSSDTESYSRPSSVNSVASTNFVYNIDYWRGEVTNWAYKVDVHKSDMCILEMQRKRMERGFTKCTKVTDEKVVRTLKDIDDTIDWVKYSCLYAYNQYKAAVNEVRFLMLGHRAPSPNGERIGGLL